MSRTDDYGLTDKERHGRSPSVFDHELPSRLGLSREAARAEMERFRGVAEYEVRKIFGQRSALKEPVEVGAPRKPRRKRADTEPPVARSQKPSAREHADAEDGDQVPGTRRKQMDEGQPAQTELELHD
jgi:hypothetical protein